MSKTDFRRGRATEMKRDKEYTQALEKARAATEDIKARGEAAIGDNALDFIDSLLTPEERAESDFVFNYYKEK